MTGFGEISPLLKNFKRLGKFFRVDLVLGKNVEPTYLRIFYAFWQICIVVNGQTLNK